MRPIITILLVAIALVTIRCSIGPQPVDLDVNESAHEKLSSYNFFTGIVSDLSPNDGVLPYDLITPLFTDYADKSRFVWMPDGTTAKYSADEALDFPVGAVLIKNFFYFHDKRNPELGKRIMETRLLVKRQDKWDALTYIWDENQKDAKLEVAGDVTEVEWIGENGVENKIAYVVPNKNQCKGCHEYKGALAPIGPKVRNMNYDHPYADGSMNQLAKWAAEGYLSGYDPNGTHGKVADWDDPASGSIRDRAMAYLEINCGHCHREEGPAGISGLNLLTSETNLFNLGFCKTPVSAGSGSGGHTYDIVPGEPASSILVYRMETNDPGSRMPELGRSVMHVEGVELVREWIGSMVGGCPESMDAN